MHILVSRSSGIDLKGPAHRSVNPRRTHGETVSFDHSPDELQIENCKLQIGSSHLTSPTRQRGVARIVVTQPLRLNVLVDEELSTSTTREGDARHMRYPLSLADASHLVIGENYKLGPHTSPARRARATTLHMRYLLSLAHASHLVNDEPCSANSLGHSAAPPMFSRYTVAIHPKS